MSELSGQDDKSNKIKFDMYLKHLFKAKAPTPENLADEKYIKFI